MEMIDPSNINAGLFLVIMATAIATIFGGFIIVALIARFGLKIRISFSGFIASVTLSVLFFIVSAALGPKEASASLPVIQIYSFALLVFTIIVYVLFLKAFQPKNLETLSIKEYNKSTPQVQEHYKNILKELQEIEKLKIESKQNISSKFKQKFKMKKGGSNVKS